MTTATGKRLEDFDNYVTARDRHQELCADLSASEQRLAELTGQMADRETIDELSDRLAAGESVASHQHGDGLRQEARKTVEECRMLRLASKKARRHMDSQMRAAVSAIRESYAAEVKAVQTKVADRIDKLLEAISDVDELAREIADCTEGGCTFIPSLSLPPTPGDLARGIDSHSTAVDWLKHSSQQLR